MAFAFVDDETDQGTTGNPSLTLSAGAPSDGDLLVIVLSASSGRSVSDATLPAGFTPRVAENDSGGGFLIIADKIAASDGATKTVTMASGVTWCYWLARFSGPAASGYFDQESHVDLGSVTSAQPGSITPANSTELMVAAARQNGLNGGSEAIDSSFTIRSTAQLDRMLVGYKIKTTGAAENPTLSWGSSRDAQAAMVAYSTTTIGGATSRPDRHLPRGVARGVTRGVT